MTAKEMANQVSKRSSAYVTYGDGDLGKPVAREDAVIGRNGWTESQQADFEAGFADAKRGEVPFYPDNHEYLAGHETYRAMRSALAEPIVEE